MFLLNPLEDYAIFEVRYLKKIPEKVRESIKNQYVGSHSMGDFFRKLYKKYDINMICLLLSGWIDDYMRSIQMDKYVMNQHWYISAEYQPSPFAQSLFYTNTTKRNNKNTLKITKTNRINSTKRKQIWNS